MGLTLSSKVIVILLLAIGLAFKIPLPPFHGWLIEAHVESNTIGSMLLAGLVLKLAYIGYVRFIFYPFASLLYCGLTPDSNLSSLESQSILFLKNFQSIFSLWLLVAAVYITLLLFVQNDAKKFIAYTSIAHMTFSTASLFNTSQNFGFFAALFTSIAHGIVATMFFCLFGMIYERFKTRDISAISGLALTNPSFSNFFLFVTLANVGFPVTFNFIGELNSYFSFLSFFPNDSGDLNVFSLAYSLIVLLLLFGLFFFSGVAALSFFVKVVFGTPKSISSKELYGPTVGEKAILLFYSFWVFFSNLFFFFIPPMLSIF